MVTEQNKDDLLEVLYRRGCSQQKGVFLPEARIDLQWDDDTFSKTVQALKHDNLIKLNKMVAFLTLAGCRRVEKSVNPPPAVTQNTVFAGTISNATIQQGGAHATLAQRQAEPPKGVFTYDHMTVPPSLKDPDTYQQFARYHLIYSLAGLAFGFVCILGGIVLFSHGVTGSTSWTAKFIGGESKISDAPPGIILFIVGLFSVFITRFVIKTQK